MDEKWVTEEYELLMEQQAAGRGDNPEIDPPDVKEVDNGNA